MHARKTRTNSTPGKWLILVEMAHFLLRSSTHLSSNHARSCSQSRRLHNKGVYVKQAIRKMVNRSSWNNLNKAIRLEVDGKPIALPHIEGIIILNILR